MLSHQALLFVVVDSTEILFDVGDQLENMLIGAKKIIDEINIQ